MQQTTNPNEYLSVIESFLAPFIDNLMIWLAAPNTYYQAVTIGIAFASAWGIMLLTRYFFVALKEPDGRVDVYSKRWFMRRSGRLIHPLLTMLFLFISKPVFGFFVDDVTLIIAAQRIAFVWFLWVTLGAFITSTLLKTVALWILLPALLLKLFGLFEPVVTYLDAQGVAFGEVNITLYTAVKAIFFVSIVIWAGKVLSNGGEGYIRKSKSLTLSTKELLIKLFDIALYTVLFLITLNLLGIDLTALAVFSGALGVGLGFGLQKIASNFISGIILLTEKSIRINNLIEMDDGVFGHVRKLGARASVVETYDGKEVLVPNEDFITSRVANLTHSNSKGRIEIMVGVSYSSDLRKVQKIILDVLEKRDDVITKNEEQDGYFKPKCFLWEFADSSVNFRITFWLEDIGQSRWRTKSEAMFDIWDALKENGIEIPFPQRDLHIRSGLEELIDKRIEEKQGSKS